MPPLSLYIHVPWCVQKCPYCDFNSHKQKNEIPEQEYVAHLLDDLKQDAHLAQGRKLHSIFFGGGTPSLLSEQAIADILSGVEAIIPFEQNIEVTLEANPGTLEYNKFQGFAHAGVNRISIGVQSFQQEKLTALGRIHDPTQAKSAADYAAHAVNTFNIDLMHGLPNQSIEDALSDLQQAIELNPTHISWYQLTIEPNTQFHSKPPKLPQDEVLWDIQQQGHELLKQAGYHQYEISAYAKSPEHQCRHNLNYWRFGDYLGIGCGAHGKITLPTPEFKIIRTEKVKHPKGYMDLTKPYLYKQWPIDSEDLPFEYFINRLRLKEPFPLSAFSKATDMPHDEITDALKQAVNKNLLNKTESDNEVNYQITKQGLAFYNNLVDLFL
ncbi:MAG: radical SAM family heme chaperone HemW [Gammaproteobacteria bacterium]|nr:radical SAM family heme chaperone HemW [Gammaproteobacteria bacterium]